MSKGTLQGPSDEARRSHDPDSTVNRQNEVV